MKRPRSPRPRPADKIAAEFIRAHLGRGAFAPLTGTDWRAWHAFVHLVELWGVSRDPRAVEAMRACVACAQTNHEGDFLAALTRAMAGSADEHDVATIALGNRLKQAQDPARCRFEAQVELVDAALRLGLATSRNGADRQDVLSFLHRILDERAQLVAQRLERERELAGAAAAPRRLPT